MKRRDGAADRKGIMTRIHTSSTVDPRAELEEGVEIGPYCVVEGRVKIGAGTRLLHHVSLRGPMEVGRNNTFHPFACLGGAPQHRGYDPELDGAGTIIGDDNVFRESFTLNRASKEVPTTVGHRNYFMANAHVGHDSIVGNDCTLANCAALAGHVVVGDSVFLAGNSGVHQFCRVGRLAMIGAAAIIVQDLTPFCMCYTSRAVGSLNLVGLRRAGLREHIKPLNRAFEVLFRERHATPHAVALIEREQAGDVLVKEMLEFVRGTRRGITGAEMNGEERAD